MSNQFLKLRRSAVQGKIPETSSLDLGELAINTYDGQLFLKKSGSQGEIVTVVGSTGSFTGSFSGDGAGLSNIPASGITGLNLSRIATGSVSASVGVGASSFSVVSGSSTFLHISSSGNVGIGTSNPLYRLHVISTSSLDSVFNSTLATGNNTIYLDNDLGRGLRLNTYGSTATGTLLDGTINRASTSLIRTNSSTNTIVFGGLSNSAQFIYFGNTGFALSINNSTNSVAIGTGTFDGINRLQVSGNTFLSGSVTGSDTLIRSSGNTSATNALTIVNSAGSALMSSRNDGLVTLNNDTIVGNRLHVENGILFNYGGGNFNRTILSNAGLNVTFRLPTDAAIYNFTTWSSNSTIFSLGDNAAYLVPNVGIGITSPTAKLDVSGSSRFVGNMVITGSGNTSTTNALSIVNSSNSSLLAVRNDGLTTFGGNINFLNQNLRLLPDTRGASITSGFLTLQIGGTNRTFTIYNNVNDVLTVGSEIGNNIFNVPTFQFIVGAISPNVSAQVQIDSTTRGFLPPRMTEAQRLAIATPAQGLIVYDTGSATEGLWFYNSGSNPGWQEVLTNSGSQSISGSITANSITVTGTLTAQTIVAQTITSSTDFVTGSTRFGSLLSNTHQFTGSVSITGSLTLPYLSTGSVLFAGATDNIAEDNTNLFWDNANKRLGIGTNAPSTTLDIRGKTRIQSSGNCELDFIDGSNIFRVAVGPTQGFVGTISSQPMGFFTGALKRGEISTNGNFILQNGTGVYSDTAQKLQVYGDTFMRGSGITSATNALVVENSGSTSMFSILNNGYVRFGSSFRVYASSVAGAGDVDLAGEFLVLNSRSSTTETGGGLGHLTIGGVVVLGTSGIYNNASISRTFAPTSGNAVYNTFNFSTVINQTGGANGVTRGLYVNPTLTSAWDFRAIEWSNNASATSGSWGLYGAGTANNYLGGALAIGDTTVLTGHNMRIFKSVGGAASSYGFANQTTFLSSVTTTGHGFSTLLSTQATAFNMSFLYHYRAQVSSLGAGSTIGTQVGFIADGTIIGATNNYGFQGAIANGTGNWNLYMNGTADNYLAGRLSIGTTDQSQGLRIGRNPTAADSTTNFVNVAIQNSVTSAYRGFATSIGLNASGFTLPNLSHYEAINDGSHTVGVVTNLYGFRESLGTFNATNVFGFYGNIANATNRWSLYMAGTADNYLAGKLLIGTTSVGTFALDVNGTARISGSLTINNSQFNNTSSLTSAGITTVSQLSTSSYTSCFYNYTVASASNARSGQVMSVWNGSTLTYTEVVTTDIGNTSQVAVSSSLSGGFVRLQVSASSGWTFKNISNLL